MIRDYILFIDTETSGVPGDWEKKDTDHWPYIVQVAWIISDNLGKELLSRNFYIKPSDYDIEESAIKVHHITREKAMKYGVERKEALGTLCEDLRRYKPLIVGHFLTFDKSMLEIGLQRCGLQDIIKDYPLFCTMRASSGYMPWANRSYPKLDELYQALFKKKLTHSHDALHDARATSQCFFELVRRSDIDDKTIVEQQKQWKKVSQKNKKLGGCLPLLLGLSFVVFLLLLAV